MAGATARPRGGPTARGRRIALCGLAALTLAVGAPPPVSAATPLWTGIMEPPAFSRSGSVSFERASLTGATLARIWLFWDEVAGSEPPPDPTNWSSASYDWSSIDKQVVNATNAGLTPILDIRSAPGWAETAPIPAGVRAGTWKPSLTALGDFAQAAATRYDGTHAAADGTPLPPVRFWQVWNEPNGSPFLTPVSVNGALFSPRYYLRMLNAASARIHLVESGNLVVTGSVSPFHHPNVVAPLIFMANMLCMSQTAPYHKLSRCPAKAHFDIWAQNPYTTGGPTHGAYFPYDVSLGDMGKVRRLLDAAVKAGRIASGCLAIRCPGVGRHVGLWIAEFSWDSRPPDPKGVPADLEARWVAEALYHVYRLGVTAFIWHRLRDDPLTTSPYQSGLYACASATDCSVIANDRPKPALQAFRFPFVAFRRPVGVSVWGRTPWGEPGLVAVERRTASGWRRLGTAWTTRAGIFSAFFRTALRAGELRARYTAGDPAHPVGTYTSLRFSLTTPPDRSVAVFGCGGPIAC